MALNQITTRCLYRSPCLHLLIGPRIFHLKATPDALRQALDVGAASKDPSPQYNDTGHSASDASRHLPSLCKHLTIMTGGVAALAIVMHKTVSRVTPEAQPSVPPDMRPAPPREQRCTSFLFPGPLNKLLSSYHTAWPCFSDSDTSTAMACISVPAGFEIK